MSRSGYYAWRSRKPSKREMANRELAKEIRRIYDKNRRVYGSPRVQKALRRQGIRVNHKRTARIMRGEGIRGRICLVYRRVDGPEHEPSVSLSRQCIHGIIHTFIKRGTSSGKTVQDRRPAGECHQELHHFLQLKASSLWN